ncbi:MFS transporter [Tardiphaga alba]|uniref:MFS transporter n=1 Tax=Tardiphaga alba TaxID=340268 RepID=A0ABX8ABY9_9BRAD|nr:MFS transporter [Tardiphaga alba]QUS41012.1 MFS transporter [Tardiphaga alba]
MFYGTVFGSSGFYLPFFPVWLKAIGIDPAWIGIILAVPSTTRFTTLPFITAFAERHHALRQTMIVCAFLTMIGFAVVGMLREPLAILLMFALTAVVWTPLTALTDGYALKGVVRFGFNYGPLRLWGSAAFVVGALACGLVVNWLDGTQLIWVIVGAMVLSAIVSLGLQPLGAPIGDGKVLSKASALLRDPGFLAIAASTALIQGSHAGYYTFASITWQAAGYDGLTIAGLWTIGVLAEIVLFALSPRITFAPATLVILGGLGALLRWTLTAQTLPLPVLVVVQVLHGATYGLTQLGTMGLLLQHVPPHVMARAQGYVTACTGLVMSSMAVLSGAIYARYGEGVYYVMAVLGAAGACVIWFGRKRVSEKLHDVV